MEAEFTDFRENTNWVNGIVGDNISFSAKLYNEPSKYCLNGGRVSNMFMYKGHVCIFNYNYDDHSDGIEINEENVEYFECVMELLENSPERDFD